MTAGNHATTGYTGAIADLRDLLGDRLSESASVREQHGHGESWHPAQAPDAVCFPLDTHEVAKIVAVCREHHVPMIPFGAGTSLEGHVNAPRGGVCIDMSRMNAILAVHQDDMDCRVQAGVTRLQLNAHLRDTGLFFPVDPGADATLGGMASTRASGTNAVRYGTMRENVLSMTVVTPQGDIVRLGSRARKSSAGYDLRSLLIGAEGTLGIITEISVRLHPMPEAMSAAVVNFPSVDAAAKAAITTIQYGIPVARVELMDAEYMRAVNQYSGTDYNESDTLFLEFHGTPAFVEEQATQFGEIAREFDGGDFRPIPREPLPFPGHLVASRNDPYCKQDIADDIAASWGALFMDAGEAGHIDSEAGFGPWPEGLMVFARFLGRLEG